MHPAIVDTLKAAYFAKPSSLGYEYLDKFNAGKQEPELPFPLIALSATGVFHGIYEYKTGAQVETNFDGNTFISTYTSHIRSLEKLKDEKPARYRHIMSTLYRLAVSHPTDIGTAGPGDVFDLIED